MATQPYPQQPQVYPQQQPYPQQPQAYPQQQPYPQQPQAYPQAGYPGGMAVQGVSAMPVNAGGQPMMGQVPPGQQQIIIVQQTGQMNNKKKSLFLLGTVQVVLGCALVIFNIAAICMFAAITTFIAPGIWNGIIVIIAGAFGIVASKKLTKGYVITFMVMSIISAVCVWTTIGCAAAGIALETGNYYYYYGSSDASVALNSLLLIFGFIEAIIAIVASAICCGALCGNSHTAMQVAYQQNGQQVYINPAQPQQMVLSPQPQVGCAQPGPHTGAPTAPVYPPSGEMKGSGPPPAGMSYDNPPPYSSEWMAKR